MLKYAFKYAKFNLFQRFIYSVLSVVPALVNVLLIKILIDSILGNCDWKIVFIIVSVSFMASMISTVTNSYILNIGNKKAALIIQQNMQESLMQKSRNIDMFNYDDPNFYDKYTLALHEAENRVVQVLDTCTSLLSNIFNIFTLVSIIAYIKPLVMTFSIVLMIINFFIGNKKSKIQYKYKEELTEYERKNGYLKGIFYSKQYANEIRINDISKFIIKKFKKISQLLIKLNIKQGKAITKYDTFVNSLTWLNSSAMMFYLGILCLVKKITIGDFSAMFNAAQQLTHNLLSFVNQFPAFYQHSLFIDNFKYILNYKSVIENNKGQALPTPIFNSIEFRNVSFSYSNSDSTVLKNINIEIKRGMKIAIVGVNGAGKTTLIRLLLRLYDPTSGEILIDGTPINKYITQEYRQLFGTVLQDPLIYALSVANNVLLKDAETEAETESVRRSLQFAGIEYKIKDIDTGINTNLSKEFDNNGIVLSGGERQKITIARAYVNQAPILVLDEPSSSLDPISEYEIHKRIIDLAVDKTIILISHRLSTICMADKIYVIDNGIVVEQGSHTELLQINGKYCDMWNKQSENYKIEQREE